jgi:predicted transcriptional regulator
MPLTVSEDLAARVRQLAERDCLTITAAARRLIAQGVAREALEGAFAESDRELAGVR